MPSWDKSILLEMRPWKILIRDMTHSMHAYLWRNGQHFMLLHVPMYENEKQGV